MRASVGFSFTAISSSVRYCPRDFVLSGRCCITALRMSQSRVVPSPYHSCTSWHGYFQYQPNLEWSLSRSHFWPVSMLIQPRCVPGSHFWRTFLKKVSSGTSSISKITQTSASSGTSDRAVLRATSKRNGSK